jgi:hypothetical protein
MFVYGFYIWCNDSYKNDYEIRYASLMCRPVRRDADHGNTWFSVFMRNKIILRRFQYLDYGVQPDFISIYTDMRTDFVHFYLLTSDGSNFKH